MDLDKRIMEGLWQLSGQYLVSEHHCTSFMTFALTLKSEILVVCSEGSAGFDDVHHGEVWHVSDSQSSELFSCTKLKSHFGQLCSIFC